MAGAGAGAAAHTGATLGLMRCVCVCVLQSCTAVAYHIVCRTRWCVLGVFRGLRGALLTPGRPRSVS